VAFASTTPVASEPGPRAWWQGLSPIARRRIKRSLAAFGVLVLAVGVVLARFLSVENTERDADLALVQAEARGDAAAMIEQISGCRTHPACVSSVRANVANPRLRRKGAIKILSLESPTAYSLGGATGSTRLAWTVIGTLPVVQCVGVSRTGNVLTGIHVKLLSLSTPIDNEGQCSGRTRHTEQEEEEVKSLNGP
jgi:hypothetical protein